MIAQQQLNPAGEESGRGLTNVAGRQAKAGRVCAVIVTYNGGSQISATAVAIIDQVDHLLIVDNHSDHDTQSVLEQLQTSYPSKMRTILNDTNRGIAAALNQGVKFAKDNDFEWLMTLDQDTIIENGAVTTMLATFQSPLDSPQIAIIAPHSIFLSDVQLERSAPHIGQGIVETEMIHTSGNLVRTSVFDSVGSFREEFFIDQVDYEFCFRLREAGFKIVLNRNAVAYHRPGDLRRRKLFSKQLFITNYSALRRYYIARNGIVLSRESRNWSFFKGHATFVFKESVKVLLYETNKLEKLILTLRGIADGVLNKLGKSSYKERA